VSAGPQHTTNDLRRSRRYRQALRVDVVDKRGTRTGTAVDVARHGLFVAIVDPPHNRHLVQLTLHLPDGPLQAAATVARVLPGQGVGLALFALSADAKRRWDAFIALAQQHEQAHTSRPPTSPFMPSLSPSPSPSQLPSFLVRLKTIERLREYLQNHVAVGGTVLYTPVLPPQGSGVQLIVVHPRTWAEYPLYGVIHRAVATPPKHLEILFSGVDVEAFARYIEDGRAPSTPPTPVSTTPSTAGPASEPEPELEIEIDDDDSLMQEEPVKWDLRCEIVDALGDDDEDTIGTRRGPADPMDEVTDPRRGAGSGGSTLLGFSIDVDLDLKADDGLDADEELLIDDTVAAADPGLRPISLRLFCEDADCATEAYTVELGPCGGVLGLVADQVPFWSAAHERVVSVPRLVPAETRRARFARYVAGGGSLGDVVTLGTFLAAADLAEAPRHPVTAEALRSSRAIERLASAARHAVAGEPAVTKVRCPTCGGHLVLERV
jgi:hypothetical protein